MHVSSAETNLSENEIIRLPQLFSFSCLLILCRLQIVMKHPTPCPTFRGQLELESALLCNRSSRRRMRGGK